MGRYRPAARGQAAWFSFPQSDFRKSHRCRLQRWPVIEGWGIKLRWLLVTLVSVTALLAISTPAVAGPPPDRVKPLDCLREWDSNDNYVGDGWPRAHVVTINGIVLRCGDESTGVVHIAGEGTTGSRHPISPEMQSYFLQCFDLITREGERGPDPDGPDRELLVYFYFDINRPTFPGEATAVIDKATGRVRTVFTSTGASGNDWLTCAAKAQVA